MLAAKAIIVCVCHHTLTKKMIKNLDAVSRYIDPLINKYLVAVFIMHDNDVRKRHFAYYFDVFLNCSNHRHIKHADLLPKRITIPTVPNPLIHCYVPSAFLYHVLQFIAYLLLLSSASCRST